MRGRKSRHPVVKAIDTIDKAEEWLRTESGKPYHKRYHRNSGRAVQGQYPAFISDRENSTRWKRLLMTEELDDKRKDEDYEAEVAEIKAAILEKMKQWQQR